jgi:hypothetical protein
MRAFMMKYRGSLPETAVFLTHDSPDVAQAFADVDELLARGEVNRKTIQAGGHHEAVQEFLEKLRA